MNNVYSNDILQIIFYKQFILKKESWPKFFSKAFLLLLVILVAGTLFFSRFKIVGDPQSVRCIPAYSVYLLDTQDTTLIRDALYAFRSNDLNPIYAKDTKMLKYLKALPGDKVIIKNDQSIYINGKYSAFGLSLAQEKLAMKRSDFTGETILKTNQYWFLGTSPKSFDSRYWGAVTKEQVLGRAYPLF